MGDPFVYSHGSHSVPPRPPGPADGRPLASPDAPIPAGGDPDPGVDAGQEAGLGALPVGSAAHQ